MGGKVVVVGLVERCISLPACLPSNTLTRTPSLPLSQASRSSLKSFHTSCNSCCSSVSNQSGQVKREGRKGREGGREEGNLPFFGIMLYLRFTAHCSNNAK